MDINGHMNTSSLIHKSNGTVLPASPCPYRQDPLWLSVVGKSILHLESYKPTKLPPLHHQGYRHDAYADRLRCVILVGFLTVSLLCGIIKIYGVGCMIVGAVTQHMILAVS